MLRTLFLLVAFATACHGQDDRAAIEKQIQKYAAAADAADPKLAGEVWSNTDDISFIHPQGHEHGWEQVKTFYVEKVGAPFSQRKLTVHDVKVHLMGNTAWAEFYWHFTATLKSNGGIVNADGRETQIYRKAAGQKWELVHVHYSGPPITRPGA
jgi:ketosteroid isomerase-like protein